MPDPDRRRMLAGAFAAGCLAPGAALADGLVAEPGNWATLTKAERDALYNNSAAVPGSAGIVDGWTAASAELRKRHAGTVDLPYGPRERNRWDLFPASDPKAPCLVFIHGGYWISRSRETFACMMEGVLGAGFSAALPGYTLAPAVTLTEIVAEVTAALDWLGREGPGHGIAGPVFVSGWSAGGQLAAMALAHPLVRAGIAFSGIYELGPLRDTYINEKLKLTDPEMAALSPPRLPPVEKPLHLAYGTGELPPLVENARAFHAYRAGHHVPGALIPIPHANHFTMLDALRQPDGVLARAVKEMAANMG